MKGRRTSAFKVEVTIVASCICEFGGHKVIQITVYFCMLQLRLKISFVFIFTYLPDPSVLHDLGEPSRFAGRTKFL